MAGQPISGRYSGAMIAPKPNSEILELRVDVDALSPSSPVTNRISGDFIAVNLLNVPGDPPQRWNVYRESWIVNDPQVTTSSAAVDLEGTVVFWEGTHPSATVSIHIPLSGSIGLAEVTLKSAEATIATYSCPRLSDAFRDLDLEVDVCQSVNQPPLLPTFNTALVPSTPAVVGAKTLTVASSYAEAGVSLTIRPNHTVIDDSDPKFVRWTDAELHDAMESYFADVALTWPSWALWGVLAGTYENPRVGGIMFDTAMEFGGPSKPPERQGFAVFRNHSWFAQVPTSAPNNATEAEALRKYLYTWVHEAGHAFNFLHSWDKNRPDALSWMNYDWKYDARNGDGEFWKAFTFRFDNEELIHLRHGNRAAVIMGGDAWGSGGHAEAPPGAEYLKTAPTAAAQAIDAGPIELLLRSKGYFEFMEPVKIEVRLRNLTSNIALPIETELHPEFGALAVFIRRPNGRIVEYAPVACKLAQSASKKIEPATPNDGSDRFSAEIDVTYGRYGFYFDDPGDYFVRAVYHGAGDLLIPSNTMRLRVGHPASSDLDRQAQDFFSPEVGLNLYFGGSASPHLKKGLDRVRDLASRHSDTVMSAELRRTIANSVAKPFFAVERVRMPDGTLFAKVRQIKKAEPEAALKLTTPAVRTIRKSGDKNLNLAYGQLVIDRTAYRKAVGDTTRARNELNTLVGDLANRGAHKVVLASYRQLARSLTPQSKKK
jgi:hypothetical protein